MNRKVHPLVLTTVTNVAIQGAGFLSGLLVARLLGPEGRGGLAVATMWASILSYVTLFGRDVIYAREAARRPEAVRSLYKSALLGGGGSSLAMACVAYLMLPFLIPAQHANVLGAALLALLIIPGSVVNVLAFSIAQGARNFALFNGARAAFSLAYIVALAILMVIQRVSIETVVLAQAVAAALAALGSCGVGAWNTKPGSRMRIDRSAGDMIRNSVAAFAIAAAGQGATIAMSLFTDAKTIGLIAVAVSVTGGIAVLGASFSKTYFAELASLEGAEMRAWVSERVRRLIVLSACASVVAVVVLPVAVMVILGHEYWQSAVYIVWFLPVVAAGNLSLFLEESLRARLASTRIVRVRVQSLVITIGMCGLLTRVFGVSGGAVIVALATASAVELVFYARLVATELGLSDVVRAFTPRIQDVKAVTRRIVGMLG